MTTRPAIGLLVARHAYIMTIKIKKPKRNHKTDTETKLEEIEVDDEEPILRAS